MQYLSDTKLLKNVKFPKPENVRLEKLKHNSKETLQQGLVQLKQKLG